MCPVNSMCIHYVHIRAMVTMATARIITIISHKFAPFHIHPHYSFMLVNSCIVHQLRKDISKRAKAWCMTAELKQTKGHTSQIKQRMQDSRSRQKTALLRPSILTSVQRYEWPIGQFHHGESLVSHWWVITIPPHGHNFVPLASTREPVQSQIVNINTTTKITSFIYAHTQVLIALTAITVYYCYRLMQLPTQKADHFTIPQKWSEVIRYNLEQLRRVGHLFALTDLLLSSW